MGLSAGERPAADVEVLCSAVASVEFELARRMVAAARAGSLPLVGDGAMLLARGWSTGWARRLARAGAFAEVHPALGEVWASGVITSEHVHALARHADHLTAEQMAAVITELGPWWGQLSPVAVAQFVARVIRALNPPPDPEPDEAAAHESRSLSFALTSDSVILAGVLPRLEGEAVIAAIDAFAERLRSEADHVPASARRADGLVALVNAAHATDSIPTRGGLPVSVVSHPGLHHPRGPGLDHLPRAHPHRRRGPVRLLRRAGHPDRDRHGQVPRHHQRTPHAPPRDPPAGHRRAGSPTGSGDRVTDPVGRALSPSAVLRIAELATTLLGTRIPLAVGRTARTATPSPTPGPRGPGPGVHHPRAAESPPRPARPTTSRTGPPAGTPTYPTWPCCAGRITGRSTWACGPSSRRPTTQYPNPNPAPHPEPPGPPTTAHPGPSPAHPEHAGGL